MCEPTGDMQSLTRSLTHSSAPIDMLQIDGRAGKQFGKSKRGGEREVPCHENPFFFLFFIPLFYLSLTAALKRNLIIKTGSLSFPSRTPKLQTRFHG